MDFGLFTMFEIREGASQAETFDDWFHLIDMAESLGLDSLRLGESHFRLNRAVISSPLTVASAVAARTSRIKIGLAVQVLPLANPIRIAEEAAIVDHISKGRLEFGVGRSSFIYAYQGFNINYQESRSRFSESLDIILKAWRDEPFSHKGEFYTFNNVNVVPKPLQRPHPPVRVAVQSADTFRLVGGMGHPIFIRLQMPVPQLRELLQQYQEARKEAGFPGPNDVNLLIPVYVADSLERALSEPEASAMRQRRAVLDLLDTASSEENYQRLKRVAEAGYDEVLQSVIFGTPELVTERIRELQEELGLSGLSLDMNPGGQIPKELVINSMRLLTNKVMPHFK